MTTTLRDIITEDSDARWVDTAGDVWDVWAMTEKWGEDLDREASCVDGRVRYIGPDGYIIDPIILWELTEEAGGPRNPRYRRCSDCGQDGYVGAYPFATIPDTVLCDDCT